MLILTIIAIGIITFFLIKSEVYTAKMRSLEQTIDKNLLSIKSRKGKEKALTGMEKTLRKIEGMVPRYRIKASNIRSEIANLLKEKQIDTKDVRVMASKVRKIILHSAIGYSRSITIIVLITLGGFAILLYYLILLPQQALVKSVSRLARLAKNLQIADYLSKKELPFSELDTLINSHNHLLENAKVHTALLESAIKADTPEELTKELFKELKKHINISRISFASVHEDRFVIRATFRDYKESNIDIGFSGRLSQEILMNIGAEKEIIVIDDMSKYVKRFPNSKYANMLLKEGMSALVLFPIYKGENCIGLLIFGFARKEDINERNLKHLQFTGYLTKVLYQKATLIESLLVNTIFGFARLVEQKDKETAMHLQRMAHYSRAIATKLIGHPEFTILTPLVAQQIFEQAPLHDIGKVGIPESILLKPTQLTREEFEIMKQHTIIGYNILQEIDNKIVESYGRPFFEVGKRIARHHHERWDGTGYPDGLKGKEIPPCARIVAVADVFDALTTKRTYKEAFNYDYSVNTIVKASGTQFDPNVIEAFMKAQNEIENIYNEFRD